MISVKPVIYGVCINPEDEIATANKRLVVLRTVGKGGEVTCP